MSLKLIIYSRRVLVRDHPPSQSLLLSSNCKCGVGCILYYIVFNDVQQVIAVHCYCNGLPFIKVIIFIFRAMVSATEEEGVIDEYRIKTRSLVAISFKFATLPDETHARQLPTQQNNYYLSIP